MAYNREYSQKVISFLGVPAAGIVTLAQNSNPHGRRRVFRCIFCGHSKANAPKPQKDDAPTANAKIGTYKYWKYRKMKSAE
ncbi:hypothetical protein [Flavobacterium aurantiibacter]|uniref:Uncharacterized protein n=1 Tax=Flavobacterium aurantiibacter TaxID=2023067 RepID=A0A255ZGP6_9FLAO|nr:hypothetical protein [Flavobacterium aurantiibacter]OYQ40636.1 hypothetical protein CHX27_13215 [Flavobacterium aurantiibacter]